MSVEETLRKRSGQSCELCTAKDGLEVHVVGPEASEVIDNCALLCRVCSEQIDDTEKMDENHWRCLNDSMWSQVPAVQVLAWRMLTSLAGKGWPQDLLDMMYLEDDVLTWAKAGMPESGGDSVVHRDSNGATLAVGDSVTLIKDLNVKGGGFTAKRGTMVRAISLVADNAEHIEGKVSGQQIVILTKYVKKSS